MELFFNDMVEEIALEVYFELHRAVKLGYFDYCYPEEKIPGNQTWGANTHIIISSQQAFIALGTLEKAKPLVTTGALAFESHGGFTTQDKSLDIFGNSAQDVKKFVECSCPKCNRVLGTAKFAPHLEKCLGMGRNSSRIANKKSSPIIDSDDEDDENEGEEWVFPVPDKKNNSKSKSKKDSKLLDRPSSNSPKLLVKGSRASERSISPAISETSSSKPVGVVYTVDYFKSLSSDQKRSTLQEMCGVISERTKRLCTRSMNCPQHTEEQKRRVRMTLMDSSNDADSSHPSKKLKLESNNSGHLPSHDESDSIESGDKQRSWSPHRSGQSSLSATAATGKTKKSSSKKSRSHHDPSSSSSSSSKKSKLKKQQANKQPVTVKAYTDMPIF